MNVNPIDILRGNPFSLMSFRMTYFLFDNFLDLTHGFSEQSQYYGTAIPHGAQPASPGADRNAQQRGARNGSERPFC